MRLEDEIKVRKFDNEWRKAVVNVIYTGHRMTEIMIDILKPYNINDQHFNILRILRGRYPECVCPGEIKEVLLYKRGDLTRLVDKLVALKHADRYVNPDNRRMMNVVITQKGLDLLKLLETKMSYLDDIKNTISEEEAVILNKILDKLRK